MSNFEGINRHNRRTKRPLALVLEISLDLISILKFLGGASQQPLQKHQHDRPSVEALQRRKILIADITMIRIYGGLTKPGIVTNAGRR